MTANASLQKIDLDRSGHRVTDISLVEVSHVRNGIPWDAVPVARGPAAFRGEQLLASGRTMVTTCIAVLGGSLRRKSRGYSVRLNGTKPFAPIFTFVKVGIDLFLCRLRPLRIHHQ